MKTLTNITSQAPANSPEFLESLQELIIDPLTKQGAKFLGYSATANQKEQAGLHTLIFDLPSGFDISDDNLKSFSYSDEGTTSFYHFWFGTLYILIPIPF